MNLIKEFTNLTDENISYDELKSKYEIKAPADFNFAYDVVDRYAKDAPEKRALVWCDDDGNERTFTFSELSRKSKQAAAFFSAQGIRKGDKVMMILRRRWEFWVILLAMHRIGAVAIPATNQLLTKDIEYRFNAAKVKMIVALDEEKIIGEIEVALEKSTSVEKMVIVRSQKNDTKTKKEWLDFGKEVAAFGEDFKKPEGSAFPCGNDTMLLYFTSGTSGNPKMVQHNFL
ncbi:AMP-binding protein, partial [Treponema saccharophilum]|uniref:AMP-binding protein n=1 Tax=Treponema saccharophilum TaxID=165 RepID=UPI0038692AC3